MYIIEAADWDSMDFTISNIILQRSSDFNVWIDSKDKDINDWLGDLDVFTAIQKVNLTVSNPDELTVLDFALLGFIDDLVSSWNRDEVERFFGESYNELLVGRLKKERPYFASYLHFLQAVSEAVMDLGNIERLVGNKFSWPIHMINETLKNRPHDLLSDEDHIALFYTNELLDYDLDKAFSRSSENIDKWFMYRSFYSNINLEPLTRYV